MSPADKPKKPGSSASRPGRETKKPRDRRVIVASLLGAALVLTFLGFLIFGSLGEPSVPEDAIAKVEDTTITKDQFDSALRQAAARQGIRRPPKPDNPQYELLRNQAISDTLDVAWIEGEAKDRGIEATDREIAQQLKQIKEQNFRSEAQFQQFLARSGFTKQDVDTRVRLQVLSGKIQQAIARNVPKVSEGDLKDVYEASTEQYRQPEQRDVRLILNKDSAKVEAAKAELEDDGSDASWKKVAKRYSTDVASKENGGERSGLTPGLLEGELDTAVFDASTGEIQGPVKTPLGFYIFEVTKVTPPRTTPFADVKDQLRQTVVGKVQQNAFEAFIADYREKWIDETVCAKGFTIDRCDNFKQAVAACPPESVKKRECPAPVTNIRPIVPGTALPFGLAPPGPVQRPHPPGATLDLPGLPGGVPGAPGIPGAPPGAAPPGAAPPGAAPPGSAPPAPPPGG